MSVETPLLVSSSDRKTRPHGNGFVDSVGFFTDNIEDNAPPPVEESIAWNDQDSNDRDGKAPSVGSDEGVDLFGAVFP